MWPETVVKCCFFHLTQNVWRKVQAAGMQADYSQDEELAIRIRQLPALAFAHPYDVHQLFAEVAQQLPMSQATELVLYFERTYIGRTLPGRTHQTSLFPLKLWNYYYETPFGLPAQPRPRKLGTVALTLLLAATTAAFGSSLLPSSMNRTL